MRRAKRRGSLQEYRAPVNLSPATFRRLFEEQRDPLFRLLYRLGGDAAEADDVVQDAFLAVWRKRDQYRGQGPLEGYLRKTAYRLFLNHRKSAGRLRVLPDESMTGAAGPEDDSVERKDAMQFLLGRVQQSLDALPEGPREAFLLFRFEGLSCAEIAAMTDTPVKTVETRLRRATQLLAEKLRPLRNHLPVF